jgi:hypothetical protein
MSTTAAMLHEQARRADFCGDHLDAMRLRQALDALIRYETAHHAKPCDVCPWQLSDTCRSCAVSIGG